MTYTDEEYEQMSIITIRNYLNRDFTDDEIKAKFSLAIKKLINNSKAIESNKTIGVKSISEGNQSITFADNIEPFSITSDIKALLPTPYVRLL